MAETGDLSSTIEGDKLYQKRAREALPLLVRQAEAARTIEYTELARELKMSNPRNLNYVLGAIGNTLAELSSSWVSAIPPIQCVVVNKSTGLPGDGIGWFLHLPEEFGSLSRARQREIIDGKLQDVFGYTRWRAVLTALNLPYEPQNYTAANQSAVAFGAGESEDHKKLKAFVARNPSLLGLPPSIALGDIEYPLPSGDVLDVSFRRGEVWVAAEVKPFSSPSPDIVPGIHQCVKYLAVMRAVQTSENRDRSARVVLVLGGSLPTDLVGLKNQLGIDVLENVATD